MNELFKPLMTPKPRLPSKGGAITDKYDNPLVNAEIHVLKDCVSQLLHLSFSQLLADVSQLKSEMNQAKGSVSSFTT